jgi:hypothetical protein
LFILQINQTRKLTINFKTPIMAQFPTSSLVAVATGIIGSAWTSGAMASFTVFSMPTALDFPSQQAQLWNDLFVRGFAWMPKLAVTVGLSYAWAAYDTANRRGKWQGFIAGAALTAAIVPYTLVFMWSTNNALTNLATGAATASSTEHVAGLIRRWSQLNAVRSMLPLAGSVMGILTLWTNLV